MAQRIRRAKPRLAPKYIARRVMLALLVVAVIGVAAWQFLGAGEPVEATAVPEPSELPPSEPEPTPEPESTPESEATPVPQPIPESTSEPEPAPTSSAIDWNLLLVNFENSLPDNFSVDLEPVNETFQVDSRIAEPLLRMIIDAREDGIDLKICSAYRSVEKQEELFNGRYQAFLSQGYSEEQADALTVAETARPWTSEHHTGLAVDIVTENYQTLDAGFEQTPAFQWLNTHAQQYGFILRYPKDKTDVTQISYEPWHYRYVGQEHAEAVKAAELCLEEYLQNIFNPKHLQAEPVDGDAVATEDESVSDTNSQGQ